MFIQFFTFIIFMIFWTILYYQVLVPLVSGKPLFPFFKSKKEMKKEEKKIQKELED